MIGRHQRGSMVDRATAATDPASPVPTPEDASRWLAGFGFLVHPDLPDAPGPAALLVALRERPELTHYDPEAVEYWVSRDGVGRRERITRSTPLPILDRAFTWGEIRIVDRRHATNDYVTFGGRLSANEIDGVVIAVFTSNAPLLRRGGHSQGWDEAAENVGAFFGRVKIGVDFIPGCERRLADLRPEARYAAFVVNLADRYRAEPRLRDVHPRLWSLMSAEEHRLARTDPQAVGDGRRLLGEMHRHETRPTPSRRAATG